MRTDAELRKAAKASERRYFNFLQKTRKAEDVQMSDSGGPGKAYGCSCPERRPHHPSVSDIMSGQSSDQGLSQAVVTNQDIPLTRPDVCLEVYFLKHDIRFL